MLVFQLFIHSVNLDQLEIVNLMKNTALFHADYKWNISHLHEQHEYALLDFFHEHFQYGILVLDFFMDTFNMEF